MKKVAIIYGWAEGPWQSKKFVKAIEQAGLEFTKDSTIADVIFAHSAGCYLVPKNTTASVLALAGLPYWPGRSMASGVLRKLASEIRLHRHNKGLGWWLNKLLHNGWYIISRPQNTYYLLARHAIANLPDSANRKIILIRASDDTLMHPDVIRLLPTAKKYSFADVPGTHDDCWFNPKPYIDLLLKQI